MSLAFEQLGPERDVYIGKQRNNLLLPDAIKIDLQKPEILTQFTLDAPVYVTKAEDLNILELYSREFINRIHRKRVVKLNRIS